MTRASGETPLRHGTTTARSTRRGLLKSLAVPTVALTALGPPTAALAQAVGQLSLPQGSCRLTRTLRQSLFDGNEIRVTRVWRIRFVPDGIGVSVSGEQIWVEVDAPPSLAPLARIEESRSTESMWPIKLTPSGLIIAAGRGIEATDLDRTLQAARSIIAQKRGDRTAQMLVQDLRAELTRAGASLLDRLPDDLFFPSIGPINLSREVAMPDGQMGEFAVSYEARAVPGRGWLATAEREVTTRIAGTEQYARENWALSEG